MASGTRKRACGTSRRGGSRRAWVQGLLSGVAVGYLLDPELGRRRRRTLADRTRGFVRRSGRRVERRVRTSTVRTFGRARGRLHRLGCQPAHEPLDDAGLAHKVESVLFRDPRVPKGELSVNSENGAVFLRGEVESPELIDSLVESVRRISGVGEVVNLLHLPGTEAPHRGAEH